MNDDDDDDLRLSWYSSRLWLVFLNNTLLLSLHGLVLCFLCCRTVVIFFIQEQNNPEILGRESLI